MFICYFRLLLYFRPTECIFPQGCFLSTRQSSLIKSSFHISSAILIILIASDLNFSPLENPNDVPNITERVSDRHRWLQEREKLKIFIAYLLLITISLLCHCSFCVCVAHPILYKTFLIRGIIGINNVESQLIHKQFRGISFDDMQQCSLCARSYNNVS